jgi:hypothetical protein
MPAASTQELGFTLTDEEVGYILRDDLSSSGPVRLIVKHNGSQLLVSVVNKEGFTRASMMLELYRDVVQGYLWHKDDEGDRATVLRDLITVQDLERQE